MITHLCEKINILSISNLYNIMKFQFIIERSLHYEMNVLKRKFYTYKSFMNILFYLEFFRGVSVILSWPVTLNRRGLKTSFSGGAYQSYSWWFFNRDWKSINSHHGKTFWTLKCIRIYSTLRVLSFGTRSFIGCRVLS